MLNLTDIFDKAFHFQGPPVIDIATGDNKAKEVEEFMIKEGQVTGY